MRGPREIVHIPPRTQSVSHKARVAPRAGPEVSMHRILPRLPSLVLAVTLPLATGLAGPAPAQAQTAQLISLQVSGLGSMPFGGGLSEMTLGPGFEAQIRYNPSAFSIGAGFDITIHTVDGTDTDVTLAGGFIEPRYVIYIGSDRFAPYVSARGAVSQTEVDLETETATATGFTLNGGGGVLVVLGSRANIDLGVTLGYKDVGEAEFSTGTFDLGTGANLILRLGLAFGLGG